MADTPFRIQEDDEIIGTRLVIEEVLYVLYHCVRYSVIDISDYRWKSVNP